MTATAVAFIPATGGQSVKEDTRRRARNPFSKKAAEGQQAEIALGQLAAERAGDKQVKQFGAQMVEDHQKANQEVEQLASKEGVQLPMHLTGKHKDKKQKFSQLSGKEFDRAYMTYMLRDHVKDVKEFERGAPRSRIPKYSNGLRGRFQSSNSIYKRLNRSPGRLASIRSLRAEDPGGDTDMKVQRRMAHPALAILRHRNPRPSSLLVFQFDRSGWAQPTTQGKKQDTQIGTIEDMKKKGFEGVDFSYDAFGAPPGQDPQKIADEVMKKDIAEKSDVMKQQRKLLE